MKDNKFNNSDCNSSGMKTKERGSATVIAILVLGLLTIFVALAISRTTSEAMIMANDAAESRAYTAAEASLETMTRNFNKVFDIKLTPDSSDLAAIESKKPIGFDEYEFDQKIIQTVNPEQVVMSGGKYSGLYATRDKWKVQTTATDKASGVQVVMMREFYNNRIPIFQFGIFYDDNMEFHPGPRFAFGGRVHSNSSIFMMAQTGLYFSSRVSAAGEIITEKARNGSPYTNWNENVFIKNASGTYIQLRHDMGSVLNNTVNGPNFWADGVNPPPYPAVPDDPDMPAGYRNANWNTYKATFDNNLLNLVSPLNLPIRASQADYIELVKRPKTVNDMYNDGTGTPATPNIVQVPVANADDAVTARERFANKPGLRVSFADARNRLPGCATAVANCGVRLDGAANGDGGNGTGYDPRNSGPVFPAGYVTTAVNGARLNYANGSDSTISPCSTSAPYSCPQSRDAGRQVWVKVELVWIDSTTGLPQTSDVTKDILSLGVTEPIATAGNFQIDPAFTGRDGNSIIKLQRFAVPGPDIRGAGHQTIVGGVNGNYTTWVNDNGGMNVVVTDNSAGQTNTLLPGFTSTSDSSKISVRFAASGSYNKSIAPFPIQMFDTREGLYNDSITPSTPYPGGTVPWSGVMSVVDIDVGNLRRFLRGDFNALMPTGTLWANANGRALSNTDVPDANGWVLYVSDRRGDRDFDGEYDMEDIYGPNDGILQTGEDINASNTLQADFNLEAPRYADRVRPDEAAVADHKYYRRAVRLINGQVIPGNYDSANSANTKGFTVSSENAVYVRGNYNANGIAVVGDPTTSNNYLPQNTVDHIPAAIIADAVMILSNNWNDGKSFRYPFSLGNRTATQTTVRFAMLSGDARSSLNVSGQPNQGGGDARLNGGVHNFKRFLELWGSSTLLNYCGSLINLYYAHNNTGAFKCCTNIYSPPRRNWIFDSTFLDPGRLPPGTPFFQYIQVTGYLRVND